MEQIRILHTHEPGYGWYFTSPDVPGLTGGDESYAAAHARAEDVVRWHRAAEAAERGQVASDVEVVHFVPGSGSTARLVEVDGRLVAQSNTKIDDNDVRGLVDAGRR